MRRRRGVLAALAAAAVVLVIGRTIARAYVTHLWFADLGLPAIGWATLVGDLLVRGGSSLLAMLFLFANLYAVRRSVVSLVLPRRVGDLEFGEEVPGRYLVAAAAAIAIVTGSFLGLPGDAWPQFAIALDDVGFGERDPYFERDLGFYVTRLPAELLLFRWAQRLLIVTAIVVVVLYALTPSIRWRVRTLYVSEYVRRHLTILGGVLLLVFAWAFRLEGFNFLFDGSGPGGAFAAVDLRVRVPGSVVLAATALAAALIVIWSGMMGHIRVAFLAVTVMLLLSAVLRYVLPVALRPAGDRAGVEQPFLQTRDDFTRRAFGGDRVGSPRPGSPDSALHVAGTRGIALWDEPALRRAIDGAVGIGWVRDGDAIQALVAQRGFVEDGESTPWTITRLAAWSSDASGGPDVVGPAPGRSSDVLSPVISADSAAAYRVLSDPSEIVRGARAGRRTVRLAHAWALQNFRILFGRLPDDPVILVHPQVHERVAAVAPYFVQGDAARPALAGDTLFWLVELYTASATYPLSETLMLAGRPRRYFHPAGHAIVNSATGLVRIAPVVDPEPAVRSWIARFPELFVESAALQSGLRHALMPHPEAVRARAIAFARFGPAALDAPAQRRQLAVEHGADTVVAEGVAPLALAGREGLTLAIPVLDSMDRVAGIVVASGPDAVTRWIPATGEPRTWAGVLDALRIADSTSGRRDARPVRGRVRTVPLRREIAYVQPTYIWPTRGEPTLARVTVLVGTGPASGESVLRTGSDSLSSLPGRPAPQDPRELYRQMRDALRRGDWQAFGAAFDSLGDALERRAQTLPAGPRLDSLRAPQP